MCCSELFFRPERLIRLPKAVGKNQSLAEEKANHPNHLQVFKPALPYLPFEAPKIPFFPEYAFVLDVLNAAICDMPKSKEQMRLINVRKFAEKRPGRTRTVGQHAELDAELPSFDWQIIVEVHRKV
jgi:hypothetical protein